MDVHRSLESGNAAACLFNLLTEAKRIHGDKSLIEG